MPRFKPPSTLSVLRRHWKLLLAAVALFVTLYCLYRRIQRFIRNFKLPSTEAVLATLGISGLGWESYTVCSPKKGDTFSAVTRKLGRAQTVIPFFYGMLGEHLFADDPVTCEALRAGQANGKYWPCVDKEELEEAKAS